MLKNIIYQHLKERNDLLSKNYVYRDKLDLAKTFLESDLIKVITGPRRAGKSVFACLLLKGKNFAYLNFDDENLLKVDNYDELIKGIFEVYGETKLIFFDEIQNAKNWELFVNKLQRRGYNLIITGSNAKLLSRELATVLTGRHYLIEIFPFSFEELLKSKSAFPVNLHLPEEKGKIMNYLNDYLKSGGFPEVVIKGLEAKSYLDTLIDSILLKDVVKRYRIRFSHKISELLRYLISLYGQEFSFTRLKNILNFNSVNTVENYISYLEEAYLIYSLNRFSFKIKEQMKAPRKAFLVDNGLITARAFQFTEDLGRLMENLVFKELLKRGLKANDNIFYYRTRNGKEVDFVLKENLEIKQLIQVSYELSDIKTKKREMKALIEASEELNCPNLMIISWDEEGEETIEKKRIIIVPLWRWLLEKYER